MAAIAQAVGEDRLANPHDDLASALMHAAVDGESLDATGDGELLHPARRRRQRDDPQRDQPRHLGAAQRPRAGDAWAADLEGITPTAVEEIVRWATPVIHFRRTVTEDTEVGGQKLAKGDKVVLWYESGNRDERHFDDPYRFDITRTPNDHVGFGAGGPHFCLGANLARREIRTMFEEMFRWLPDLRITTAPDYLQSPFIHGIKRMRCEFTPTDVPLL